jgi:hypothetical protein
LSIEAILRYQAQVEKTVRYGGSRNESSISKAFHDLVLGPAGSRQVHVLAMDIPGSQENEA